ncbi:uncharacterized protein LOC6567182 [Drosophila grimshawi]|uniref:uncharacterized protein LOC6567182 n=1 Tax=Drosophila grimshawi TaxID=7222 RepID=UPI000C86F199|nr:uncharacterized protein LOC6567182 [Drosophila grimshawi]
MGNSGSANNIHRERSSIDRNSHFQTRFQHLNQNSHRQLQWGRSGLRTSSPINAQRSLTTEWRRSYPSTAINKEPNAQSETVFKVLPEVDKRLHLRATTNGAILNSGGTISGRKPSEIPSKSLSNALSKRSKTFIIETGQDRSSALNDKCDSRPEFTRSQTLLYVKAKNKDADINMNETNLSRMQRHTYSEPELINKLNQQRTSMKNMADPPFKPTNRNKYSKKRRAPEAPQIVPVPSAPLTKQTIEIPRNTQNLTDNIKPTHFAKNSDRLSKYSKQTSRPVQSQNDVFKRGTEIRKSVNGNLHLQNKSTESPKIVYRREKSSDAILLKSRKSEQPAERRETTLDVVPKHHSNHTSIQKPAVKSLNPKDKFDNVAIVAVQENKTQRTFYFGMERDAAKDINKPTEIAEEKSAPIETTPLPMIPNYDIEYKESNQVEESLDDNGLLVHIRPTLPRRQVETPSFSPTLAWRSLIEEQERIDKSNIIQIRNSTLNAASEMPIQPNRVTQIKQLAKPTHLLTTWTPEQDLEDDHDDRVKGLGAEDDSSSDEYRSKCEEDGFLFYGSKTKNYTGTPIHTFSLSLPRDSHIHNARGIGILNSSEICNYKSLQKSKPENYFHSNMNPSSSQRNLTSHAQLDNGCVTNFESSNNWMLHKNVSSTDLHTKSLEHGSKRQRLVSVEPQSIKFLTGGKHVMYLPGSNDQSNPLKVAPTNESQENTQQVRTNRNFKSRQRHMPQSLQDKTPIFPITSKNDEGLKLDDDKPFHQRFLFNNQMRLLEKKLHPEKSTKAAKLKMSVEEELEALKKVEEDFQRNRANEKENVQHQLRLYFGNDDERKDNFHSLPISPVLDRFAAINLNETNTKLFWRDDPEGCVSNAPYVSHESEGHKITITSNNM